jgi:hypothetical protein
VTCSSKRPSALVKVTNGTPAALDADAAVAAGTAAAQAYRAANLRAQGVARQRQMHDAQVRLRAHLEGHAPERTLEARVGDAQHVAARGEGVDHHHAVLRHGLGPHEHQRVGLVEAGELHARLQDEIGIDELFGQLDDQPDLSRLADQENGIGQRVGFARGQTADLDTLAAVARQRHIERVAQVGHRHGEQETPLGCRLGLKRRAAQGDR